MMLPGAGSGEAQPRMKQCKHSLNLKEPCTKLLAMQAAAAGMKKGMIGQRQLAKVPSAFLCTEALRGRVFQNSWHGCP